MNILEFKLWFLRRKNALFLQAALIVLAYPLTIRGITPDTANPAPWSAVGTEYMVAADHPLASQAGVRILAAGGNAADAAVAVSFALGVVRAYSTGLGGGGFLMIKNPGQRPVILDFREHAPAACVLEKYLDADGNPIPGKTVRGAWAAGVPGTLKGMVEVLNRYGTMPLTEVVKPALELAETGFPIDEHTREVMSVMAARMLRYPEYREQYAELYETFLRDGEPYEIGDTLRRPKLAATLRLIAVEGPDILYTPGGILHRALVQKMKEIGGPISSKDLVGYKVTFREPLAGRFLEYNTWTMPPPSSGGAVITEVLNTVERFGRPETTEEDQRELWPHFLIEGLKHAFADRALGLGDWDFDPTGEIRGAIERMTDTATATLIIQDLNVEQTHKPEHYGTAGLPDDHGTSHFCIIDAEGRAVACTETINLEFGSYVMIPGTGIILNDQLDDFSLAPNRANQFGLIQSDKNLIGPGKRPLSSMSPTIITHNDQPVLIAGGSGGPRIITGTLHIILNVLKFGMRADSAAAAPRFHHQWQPNVVHVEDDIDCSILTGLIRRGHRVGQYPSSPGHIQVITCFDGILFGASDPRKGGRPAGK